MKKFLKISVWVLTIAAIGCLWYFTRQDHVEHSLKSVEMSLIRPDSQGFIDSLEVYNRIIKICDTTKNTDITMIPVEEVRDYLKTIPWAIYTDANITLDEELVVEIIECQPIMRVFNKKGQSVYLDAEGRVFPVKNDHPLHLLVGSGNLNFEAVTKTSACISDSLYQISDLPKIYDVMRKVQNNTYSNCCVKQVYFDGKEYELVMNNVDLKVILGSDSNVELKLRNLQYFFERMQGSPDLKDYCKINFNFENQVVCTRNKNKKK